MLRRKKTDKNEDLKISPLQKIITLGLIAFFAYSIINEPSKRQEHEALVKSKQLDISIENISAAKTAYIQAEMDKEIVLTLTAEDIKNLAKLAETNPSPAVFKLIIKRPAPKQPNTQPNTPVTP